MFHMLTCFNLETPTTVDQFSKALSAFDEHMKSKGLLEKTGPIGRRQHHPIMDTDDERDHEFFFIMSFRDREQCDRAVELIESAAEPDSSIHKAVYANIRDQIFICWEDT